MRRALAALVILSASTAAVFACSTFTSSPDTPDAAVDAPGSTTAPAPPPPPPPPPADAAPDGTLFFDDFEDGDCSKYEGFVANILVASDGGYSGKHACMICRTGDAGRPHASRPFDAGPGPGSYTMTYEAKLLAATAPRDAIASFILVHGADPTATEEFSGAVFKAGVADWLQVQERGTTTKAAPTGASAIVLFDPVALDGECFLFDDVRMVFTP